MKVIIAGSRTITDYEFVLEAIEESGFKITEVVSGCANGVDKLGERYALENNIPIKLFPAQWIKYGRGAGIIRNKEMAEYADALIACWDGTSAGTRNMMWQVNDFNLKMYLKRLNMGEKE